MDLATWQKIPAKILSVIEGLRCKKWYLNKNLKMFVANLKKTQNLQPFYKIRYLHGGVFGSDAFEKGFFFKREGFFYTGALNY